MSDFATLHYFAFSPWDDRTNAWFYVKIICALSYSANTKGSPDLKVDTKAKPPRSTWTHPLAGGYDVQYLNKDRNFFWGSYK